MVPYGFTASSRADWLFRRYLDACAREVEPDPVAFVADEDPTVQRKFDERVECWNDVRAQFSESSYRVEVGQELGDFRLVGKLGEGAMGVVWEAEQLSIPRRVALKLLHSPWCPARESARRCRHEASAGGRLQHPGVVFVYAVDVWQGLPYIAQELVTGGRTLARRLEELQEASAPPRDDEYYRDTALLFARIAGALQAAHERGVIHRDVKPSNILITDRGLPKVADFGLAQVLGEESRTFHRGLQGTPCYMSPEQARGGVELDARSDVFSLGVTLYEALTLRRPFGAEDTDGLLRQIRMEDPEEPRRIEPRVPRDLDAVCRRALEKNRGDRYGSMAEMARDLGSFWSGHPVTARHVGYGTRAYLGLRRLFRASGGAWRLIASVFTLAILGVGVVVLRPTGPPRSTLDTKVATGGQGHHMRSDPATSSGNGPAEVFKDMNGNGVPDEKNSRVYPWKGLQEDEDFDGVGDASQQISVQTGQLSITGGESSRFLIDMGREFAGHDYRILGSRELNGAWIRGDSFPPLIMDHYSLIVAGQSPCTSLEFHGFQGVLDQDGRATASLRVISEASPCVREGILYHCVAIFNESSSRPHYTAPTAVELTN